MKKFITTAAIAAVGISAFAADVNVTSSIGTSTTWVSTNVYHLQDVIYVTNGATLTIEAGTKVIGYSNTELNQSDSSALVIARGSKIEAVGTEQNPIVFTSQHDTGSWRPANQEWGNLTILGDAYIADNGGNGVQPQDSSDQMEGLSSAPGGISQYGGTNDDDNSGTLKYVSLRFGGSVIGTANELNGLSLGGVGGGTTIEHIDIMNNVDDGIEIWGGKVNIRYASIWNIGDDSFDLDEGYRGNVQFVCIVQGYSSTSGTSGSGSGDNAFEMDGGENPDNSQPYANPQIVNFTIIGDTNASDYGMSYRDNFRGKFANGVICYTGKDVFTFEKDFQTEMQAAFSTSIATLPAETVSYEAANDVSFYDSSRSGNWSSIEDVVIYKSGSTATLASYASDYEVVTDAPIAAEPTRAPVGGPEGYKIVTSLNPCAANAATSTDYIVPANGFFVQTDYKGAFAPDHNWLANWTAAAEFGMIDTSMNATAPEASIVTDAAVVSFNSVEGVEYYVQASESADGPWSNVALVSGTGGTQNYVDSSLSASEFYRVVIK